MHTLLHYQRLQWESQLTHKQISIQIMSNLLEMFYYYFSKDFFLHGFGMRLFLIFLRSVENSNQI